VTGGVRQIVTPLLFLAACWSSDPGVEEPDLCAAEQVAKLSCAGDQAIGAIVHPSGGTSQTLACRQLDRSWAATCAQGCRLAVDGVYSARDGLAMTRPDLLCAEAPTAQLGDHCDAQTPCLPTRAQLDRAGEVIGQVYLTCDDRAQRCVADVPPQVDGFLQACAGAVVSRYGTAGARGAVYDASGAGACLIAWDATANVARSGVTVRCDGDWDCPAGALCDDRIPRLDGGTLAGVCKPGPRGTLTAAMLTR
jgi:hypothetical protein